MPRTDDVVRIAFLDVSPLLREMLTPAFEAEFVLEPTGDFTDPDRLIEALPAMSADVVLIASGRSGTEDVARRCLAAAPHASVLILTRGGRDALVCRLELSTRVLEGVSSQSLGLSLRETAKAKW